MNYIEYEQTIAQFDVYPFDTHKALYYIAGVNGEYDELLEKVYEARINNHNDWNREELTKEGGDVCWYLTRLANLFNISITKLIPDQVPKPDSFDELMKMIHRGRSKLTETIKKLFRDKDGKPDYQFIINLDVFMCNVFAGLKLLGENYGISLSDMMESNVKKLSLRKEKNMLHGDGDNREVITNE